LSAQTPKAAAAPGPTSPPDRQNLLEQVLENPRLPTPPALALQIVDKAGKPDCTIREITALLKQDPGLCGQLLKTVNSTVYALPRPVASIERAALVLGIKPLRSLVLGLSLPALQTKGPDASVWKYWQESVSGAVIAREMAILLNQQEPDDYLVASLLRDVGLLVLRELFPPEYEKLVASPAVSDAERRTQEEEIFGVRHEEVSASVLEAWRLPSEIVEPVRCHHNPSELGGDVPKKLLDRTWVICIADQLARGRFSTPQALQTLMQLAETHLGLSPRALSDFLKRVVPKITDFAGILKVEIGQCPNFSEIIVAGAQEMVKLAVETNNSIPRSGPRATDVPAPKTMPEQTPIPGALMAPKMSGARPPANSKEKAAGTMPDFNLGGIDALPAGGAMLNGYEIREVLGRGAMGVVFKAYDPLLRRYAAVKMLTPERVVSSEARERFKREARAAAAVQHANIVTIYAVSEANGIPYLVMEYVAGISLQEQLDKLKTLPIADIASYARQIALGLGYAHKEGIVHRDIKPANILLQNDSDVVKITDFGLARVAAKAGDVDLSSAGGWVGTPLFMAPEQFDSCAVDFHADLFSFGAVLYYLTTGKTPFIADSVPALMKQVCERRPISPRALRPETPTWLDTLIMKLLQKSPAARGASALEVERYIRRYEVLVRT
jgi:HD-like signal output (HDOD) protein/tRNA A-37 threonylcarbamoyl transferase component Bud32